MSNPTNNGIGASRTAEIPAPRSTRRKPEKLYPVWHRDSGEMIMVSLSNMRDMTRLGPWLARDPAGAPVDEESLVDGDAGAPVLGTVISNDYASTRLTQTATKTNRLEPLREALRAVGVEPKPAWGWRSLTKLVAEQRAATNTENKEPTS